jgi:Concanavalin A-like lectin/glucanases superfamily
VWVGIAAGPGAAAPAGAIVDLDFGHISGSTVPDASGSGNAGSGRKGAVGSETAWSPATATDSQGDPAAVFAGAQKERIEIPNDAGSLDVDHFSILVRFTLDESVDTDPAHQRYELMEKAGSFWFNVREDTSPKYRLRVGGFFNGRAVDTFTGTRVIPSNTLTWAVATYDGAHLTTYVADGDGTGLVLDKSVAQTGTLSTGAAITGVDENLVVGAKHRKGHAPGGTGTNEDAEAFFNGTMSRFLVYDTALTQSQIAAVIGGPAPSGTPGAVHAHLVPSSALSSSTSPTVPSAVSWAQGTCAAGSTYHVTVTTGATSTLAFTGTALSATLNLPVGATSTVAVDCGGAASSTSIALTGFQEGAATYTGTWHNQTLAGAWGGAARYTAGASASATFHCASCRSIAWVTDEDSAHGSARILVDGVQKATVSTQSATARNRVLAYVVEWAADGAHTLRIVNAATSGHPRTTVDGFLVRT